MLTGRSKNNTEDVQWFANMITRDEEGQRLYGLELGDQIAFFDERLNAMMSFEGYYKFDVERYSGSLNRKEWTFYGSDDQPADDV